jgi:hypothetical protein
MTEGYGKTINDIRITNSQFLHNVSYLKEKVAQKLLHSVHPTVKAVLILCMMGINLVLRTKLIALSIFPSEIPGGYQKGGRYFRFGSFAIYGFLMAHGFQYIIQKYIYCDGFCNHKVSPPAFLCE